MGLVGLGVVVLLRRLTRCGSKVKIDAVVESVVVVGVLEVILGRRVVVVIGLVVVDAVVVVDRNFSGLKFGAKNFRSKPILIGDASPKSSFVSPSRSFSCTGWSN